MKKKLVVLLVVVAILLAVAVMPALAGSAARLPTVRAESKWVDVKPNTCYAFEHNLGYAPLDVHAWINEMEQISSHTNKGIDVSLYTNENYVTFCNRLSYTVILKIVAE